MEHGYISTLKVFGDDGEAVHTVIDHQEDREVAEKRCDNLATFGRSHGLKFSILLCHEGNVLREWTH